MGAPPERKKQMMQCHQTDSDDADRVHAKATGFGGTYVMCWRVVLADGSSTRLLKREPQGGATPRSTPWVGVE